MDLQNVMIGDMPVTLSPGDSFERMQRVAEYASRILDDARAKRDPDAPDIGEAIYAAALNLADELFMAQDENTRLRRDILKARERLFELERENTALSHELSRIKAAAEQTQAED